jgi:hypothetical protein
MSSNCRHSEYHNLFPEELLKELWEEKYFEYLAWKYDEQFAREVFLILKADEWNN